MGIIYSIDLVNGIAYSVWDGVVTSDQWRQHQACQLADPHWCTSKIWLTDQTTLKEWRGVDKTNLARSSGNYTPAIRSLKRGRIAIVAYDTFELTTLLAQQMEKQGVSIVIFADLMTACTYLGFEALPTYRILSGLRRELREREPQAIGFQIPFAKSSFR